jgi:hypothetical protein
MTVRELADYFADREFFPNPDQHVRLVLDSGVRVELKGTTVPQDGGDAVMELKVSPVRKFMFSLKFEANPVIEAHTLEEAEAKAYEWMRHRAVVDTCTGDGDESYVAQEPYFLEEVKE